MSALWPPVHASLVGARHLARGETCQDSSQSLIGNLSDGTPYSLLMVADGHGDRRHHLSDIGSQLACAVSAELITAAAADGTADWTSWFREVFAGALPERWRQRCRDDHQQRNDGTSFSTIPYGTTLGVLLLTPQWWACAGIGDWDLAWIDRDGARVTSSEPPIPGGGEATFSLCMDDPGPQIRARCQWHAVQEGLALVLTTDGVRKSCQREHDYLVLCHYLAKEGLPPEQRDEGVDLVDALRQITSRGIGDDVSVAVAAWGDLHLIGELS